jgi:hypothetical protein
MTLSERLRERARCHILYEGARHMQQRLAEDEAKDREDVRNDS